MRPDWIAHLSQSQFDSKLQSCLPTTGWRGSATACRCNYLIDPPARWIPLPFPSILHLHSKSVLKTLHFPTAISSCAQDWFAIFFLVSSRTGSGPLPVAKFLLQLHWSMILSQFTSKVKLGASANNHVRLYACAMLKHTGPMTEPRC